MPGYPSWSAPIGALIPNDAEHTLEDLHRVLPPRILRVGLDPLERRLGLDPLDLELGYEHDLVTRPLLRNATGRSVARNTSPAKYLM